MDCDLLSDASRAVAMSYGAAQAPTQEKATRISVLIAPGGTVAATYTDFDPASHAQTVLDELRSR